MDDSLTTIERNYIEHWSRRRRQLFYSWLITGSLIWCFIISMTVISDLNSDGRLNLFTGAIFLSLGLVSGCMFGALMWCIGEFRYRRLRKRASPASGT